MLECGNIEEMLEKLEEEFEGLLVEIWEVMELIGVKGLSEDVVDEVAGVLVDLEETDMHFSDFNFSSNLE